MVEENYYLNLIEQILETGEKRSTRNGFVKTVFAPPPLQFDLSTGHLPILTTKKVSFRNVFFELSWFMQGRTDVKWLQERGVKIWDGNAKTHGSGDLGPIYGQQFRKSGPKEVDQVQYCLDLIRNDPQSRRIVMSMWNPSDLQDMALPPCHGTVIQFFVRSDEFLDLHMYQRSADVCLGLPYNITSYSLMLLMFAHCSELKPGLLTITLGDAHVYEAHVDPAREQLERSPNPFPQIRIRESVQKTDPAEFSIDDFVLTDYKHCGVLKYDFVV